MQIRKILFWGGGRYGCFMLKCFKKYYTNMYKVEGVIDQNIACNAGKIGYTIIPPQKGLEKAKDEEIEGIFISIISETEYQKVKQLLKTESIPEIRINGNISLEIGNREGWNYSFLEVKNAYMYSTNIFPSGGMETYAFWRGGGLPVFGESHWKDSDTVKRIICNSPRPLIYSSGENCSEIEKAYIGVNHWAHNYFHFMFEFADAIYMLEKNGFDGKYFLYKEKYIEEWVNLLGIDNEKIIWITEKDNCRLFHINTLVYESNIVRNPSIASRVLKEMSEEMVAKICWKEKRKFPPRVYIKRIGRRKVFGIEALLEKYGFETFIPEEHSLSEQIECFATADIVVCPHGAGATNSIYMKKNACFIELFNNEWFPLIFVDMMREKDIRYFMVVESSLSKEIDMINGKYKKDNNKDFTVDLNLLEITIKNAIDIFERCSLEA